MSEKNKDTQNTDTEDKPKKRKSKAAAGAAAGLAATSLLIGSVFSNPSEIMDKADPDAGKPAVSVQYVMPEEDQEETEEEEAEEKKKGLKDMIRRFIQALPAWAKVVFVIPMWAVGYGLIAMLTALFEPVIAPVLGVVLKWLLIAGIFAGAFFFIKKAIAPDTPMKEIFSKKNLIRIGILAAVLGAADFFAGLKIENYSAWRNTACFGAGLLILGFFALRMHHVKKKNALPKAAIE